MITNLWSGLAVMACACLLFVWLGGGILGMWASGRRFRGLGFLAFAVGFGVLGVALLGVAVVSLPTTYAANARLGLALCVILPLWPWYRHRLWRHLYAHGWRRVAMAGAGWYLLAALALLATQLPVRLSQPLPDGAYVIKNDHLHVRIQAMVGDFPADNYIPFVAGEFLLRDVQFANERPLMPGQELSNRPILMSLVYLPFRAFLAAPPRQDSELPRFQYVGASWPDVGRFGDDGSFRSFLCVALVLNAALLLGAALLLERAGIRGTAFGLALLVLVSNPYYLGQTLFTWPKSLAAFYLLLGGAALLNGHRTWVVGLLMGMAYWSHPYALAFGLGMAAFLLWRERDDPVIRRGLLPFAVAFSASVALWWGWSQWYLQIPTDLVSQNIGSNSAVEAVMVRVINLRNAFLPWDGGWSSPDQIARKSILGLAGAVGVLWLPQAMAGGFLVLRWRPVEVLLLLALPSACVIGVFGTVTMTGMHGLQAIGVVLWVLALWWTRQRVPRAAFFALLWAQLVINLAFLAIRASAAADAL